jgi:hypothetical protein
MYFWFCPQTFKIHKNKGKIAYVFDSCLPACRQAGFYEGLNLGIEEFPHL